MIETPVLQAQVEVIGPKEARYLLRLNTRNRSIRKTAVETMARDMRAGLWVMNGEAIKISDDERVIDGQHRLLAVVESGCMIPMLVVRGLPFSSQQTVDLGTKRSLGDQLLLAGDTSATMLAAIVRFAWYMDNYGKPKAFGVSASHSELRAYLDTHPEIRESAPLATRARTSTIRYVSSVAGGLHYLMDRKSGVADEFWDHLIEGDAPAGTPIFVLREALLRDLSAPHRMSTIHRAALTIKAWNATRQDRKITLVAWKSSGPTAEPFPTIV